MYFELQIENFQNMKFPVILSSVLILAFSTTIYGQVSDDINKKDSAGLKQGFWRQTDEEGRLKYEGQFKDDIPYGEFKRFDVNGKLQTISYISDNGRRSFTRSFHPNGNVMSEGLYINQKKDSLWRFIDEAGNLLTTETYQNGIRNGEMKAYHPDGQIIEILNYTNDVKDGKWQQYFMNGLPKLEAVYSEGGIVRSCQIFLY